MVLTIPCIAAVEGFPSVCASRCHLDCEEYARGERPPAYPVPALQMRFKFKRTRYGLYAALQRLIPGRWQTVKDYIDRRY